MRRRRQAGSQSQFQCCRVSWFWQFINFIGFLLHVECIIDQVIFVDGFFCIFNVIDDILLQVVSVVSVIGVVSVVSVVSIVRVVLIAFIGVIDKFRVISQFVALLYCVFIVFICMSDTVYQHTGWQ